MESLMTLSIGDFRAAELSLRLTVALIGMTSLLMLLGITCTEARYRLPLIISGVALLGAAWFEAGVWMAWREAFELAGTSYCVTGHLLGGEDRVIAWSLGVPAILMAFALFKLTFEKAGTKQFRLTAMGVLLLAIVTPFSGVLGFLLFVAVAFLLGYRITRSNPARKYILTALASTALGILLPATLGSLHSLGGGSSGDLIRGEILRSLIDILSLVVPAVILLIGALRLPDQEVTAVKG
ncbi:MAG: hypothetical protein WCI42_01290 [Verrucomicrobiota bacterium]